MKDVAVTHLAFSDDSNHKAGRYHSLCLVTVNKQDFENALLPGINAILKESGIKSEFKWQRLHGAKYRYAAEKMIDFVFNNRSKMRVDTIIWDTTDSRHDKIRSRDDAANLMRMYYHLFMSTASKRWGMKDVCWKWIPDEQAPASWITLRDCINNKQHSKMFELFSGIKIPTYESVSLSTISPSCSESNPFIQIADLFAGISACSYGDYQNIRSWQDQQNDQYDLLQETRHKFSLAEKARFPIIIKLHDLCKVNRLSISLTSSEGFHSHRPNHFLNFWLYKPQHNSDKAPTKGDL